jgi:integrase
MMHWILHLDNCVVAIQNKIRVCKGSVKFFKEAATALHLNMAIKDIDRPHIMLMLKWIKEKRNWSNHAYNKHLGYICAVIARLMDWKVIKFNPAEKIKTLPVAETKKFVPYTDDEKKKNTGVPVPKILQVLCSLPSCLPLRLTSKGSAIVKNQGCQLWITS